MPSIIEERSLIRLEQLMKALRFLTILMTTLCLYTVQTVIPSTTSFKSVNTFSAVAEAGDGAGSSDDFFSGGAGGKVTLSGKEKEGDDAAGMNMNMIILFGAVMSAPLYTMYCFDRIDTWIFVATAAIYVAAEIANWEQYKKQSERDMEAFNSGSVEGNQAQQQSLYEAAEQTNAAAEAAERRGQAAQIAAMGFFAAGAIALIMTALSYFPWSGIEKHYKCTEGLMSNNNTFDDYIWGENDKQLVAESNYGNFESYVEDADTDYDLLVRNIEMNRFVKGARSSMTVETVNEIEFLYPETKQKSDWTEAFKTIGYNIADLIIPRVQASDKGMMKLGALGLGAAAATALALTQLEFLTPIKEGLRFGFARAAAHLLFGGIAQVVAGDAKEAAQALRERANQYKELAMKLGITTLDTSNHMNTDNTYELGSAEATNVDKGSTTDTGGTCFTGSKGKLNDDKNCACKKSKGCKKSEVPKVKMANVNIPDAITASTNSLGASGNKIFNGDLEGGLAGASGAEKNAARLQRMAVGLKKKTNDGIVQAGGKPVNFNKLESSMKKRMLKAAVADLKNLSKDGKNLLASRFPGVFGEGQKVDEDPNKNIKMGDTKVKTGAIKGKIAGRKGSKKKKDPMAGFSFDLEDSPDIKPEDEQFAKLGDGSSDQDQVEMNKDDIAGDRNKNIFNLITKRYFKTAYPTFFESAE